MEPVVAVTIAVLLMGERVTFTMLGGGLMVLLAAVFLARQDPVEPELASLQGGATGDQ
ncbi:hypothetical protein D9M68_929090 [compost metagenome]